MRRLVVLIAFVAVALSDDCSSPAGSLSCGQCIKQGADCAWCRDPHTKLSSRCMNKDDLIASGKCDNNSIFTFNSVLEVRSPQKIGEIGTDMKEVGLAPTSVQLKLKKGAPLNIPYQYVHRTDDPSRGFTIQTSAIPHILNVRFKVFCHGAWVESRTCANIPDGTLMNFTVEVELAECQSNAGDVPFSVGVVGYHMASGIYVTPLCGCECEILSKQDKQSHFCSRKGNLICGQCVCDGGHGGTNCECPLSAFGVTTAKALDDKCRETSDGPICGGNGRCRCGRCECDSNLVSGSFCSCNNTSCPVGDENRQCSGRGVCQCGKCTCEQGWTREDCSCTTDENVCKENGVVCSNNGHCECGKCICNEGFTGAFCGSSETNTATTEEALNEKGREAEAPSAVPPDADSIDCEGDQCMLSTPPAPQDDAEEMTDSSSPVLLFISVLSVIYHFL